MKVVIIEDELRTARDLEQCLLQVDKEIRVMARIDSIEAGIEFFRSNPAPDLIFSDIQIADGLSFEIFREIAIPCPVVFCTAYDEFALQAFRSNGIDYILKPFDERTIGAAIGKYYTLKGRPGEEQDRFRRLLEDLAVPKKSSLLINFRGKMFPVKLRMVAYFYVENETTMLYSEGNLYALDHSLEVLEKMLDPNMFFRVNRQYLVNRAFIKEVEPYFARKLALTLSIPIKDRVTVSKAKAAEFLQWLEQ
jgi:two-component system response regulator LytT